MSFSARLKRKRQKDSRMFYLRNQSLFIAVGVGAGLDRRLFLRGFAWFSGETEVESVVADKG